MRRPSVRRLPRKVWLPPSDRSSDRTNRIGLGLLVQRAGTRDKSQSLGRQASGPARRSCSGSDDPLHCERSPDIPSVRYRLSHPEAGGPSTRVDTPTSAHGSGIRLEPARGVPPSPQLGRVRSMPSGNWTSSHGRPQARGPATLDVGARGFEPLTSSVSRRRSPGPTSICPAHDT